MDGQSEWEMDREHELFQYTPRGKVEIKIRTPPTCFRSISRNPLPSHYKSIH